MKDFLQNEAHKRTCKENASDLSHNYGRTTKQVFTLFVILLQTGCTLFFGNIKPVEQKSSSYKVTDLALRSSDWERVDQTKRNNIEDENSPQSGVVDTAFQAKQTGSIISINSLCKHYDYDKSKDLTELSRELLLDVTHPVVTAKKEITVDQRPALETTIQGKVGSKPMTVRTVVLQRENCVFDLMYVAPTEKFNLNEEEFSSFVSSFRFK